MNNLDIRTEDAIKLGNDLNSMDDELSTLLSQIRNANETLKSYWSGSDAEKYAETVEEKAKKIDELIEIIHKYGNYLVNVGKTYAEAIQQNESHSA